MGEHSVPDFHDALVCEALITLRTLTEAARIQAQAIEAQASMVERLIDGARRYKGPCAAITSEASVRSEPRMEIHGAPGMLFRTREGREIQTEARETAFQGIDPDHDFSTLTRKIDEACISAKVEAIREDIVSLGDAFIPVPEGNVLPVGIPTVEIVEKKLEEVDPNTTLDASGHLVPAEPDVANEIALERARLAAEIAEQDARATYDQRTAERIQGIVESFRPDLNPPHDEDLLITPIAPPREDEIKPGPGPEKPAIELSETFIKGVKHKAQKAVEAGPAPVQEKATDRVIRHYAETGDSYEDIAKAFGISSSTVVQYISTARAAGDPRAAEGDGKRLDREGSEEAGLRGVLIKEATSKRDIVFPEDDMIGVPAYVVNYGEKQIETSEGVLPLSPAWLRVMDILKDRDQHDNDSVWKAARFTSERMLLKNLRLINEALAAVKLYIVADAKHYQLCALL